MNAPLAPELRVNNIVEGQQIAPQAAALAGGGYVAVWVSDNADGSGTAVMAQVFSNSGGRAGPATMVAQTRSADQSQPAVTATDNGGFAVVWRSAHDDYADVMGRVFGADGLAVDDEFKISDVEPYEQYEPSIAGLPDGGFAVSWTSSESSNSSYRNDIRTRFFTDDGAPVGDSFVTNTSGTGLNSDRQYQPTIAAIAASDDAHGLPEGGVVAVWTDDQGRDGAGLGLFAQIHAADGTPLGGEFQVNEVGAGGQSEAHVVGLVDGRFAVVWESPGSIKARIFEGDGTAASGDITVNATSEGNARMPALAGAADGGFWVVWHHYTTSNHNLFPGEPARSDAIIGRRFDADGVPASDEVLINEQTAGDQRAPAVAGLASGALAVLWQSETSGAAGDGSGWGVFQRLLGDADAAPISYAVPEVEALSTVRTFAETAVNLGLVRLDANGATAVSDPDSPTFAGGRLIVGRLGATDDDTDFAPLDHDRQDRFGFVSGGAVAVADGAVQVDGVEVGSLIGDGEKGAPLIVRLNASANARSVEILIEHLGYGNASDDPDRALTIQVVLEDGTGVASEPVLIDVTLEAEADAPLPDGPEMRLNARASGDQFSPAVAALADGGWVAVWSAEDPETGEHRAVMRRFDADGGPIGGETLVESTDGDVDFQSVAGLADGGWVVVWDSGSAIRLSRYDASGDEVVSDLQVETQSEGVQYAPRAAGLADGGYAVAWNSYTSGAAGDGSGYGVFVQVYNAAGAPVGGETLANVSTDGSQYVYDVEALDTGGFVVAWADFDSNADGSGTAVRARIFDASGTPQGGEEIALSTTAEGNQEMPRIAGLTGGGFVAAWRSHDQDGSNQGVYARLFDEAGAAIGEEIRVNDYVAGDQQVEGIAALEDGGFVIGFSGRGYEGGEASGAYDYEGVWTQAFNADGTRRDSQVLVNEQLASDQSSLELAGLVDGGYIAVWRSLSQTLGDGDAGAISWRSFGTPTNSIAPVLNGLSATLSATEAEAQAGLRLLPDGFVFEDADSADLAGGSLRATPEPGIGRLGYGPSDDARQDALVIIKDDEVSLSDGSISVGGTLVARVISDGAAGRALELEFLAGATPERVEKLLAALHYVNASEDPSLVRSYSLEISDGDGGWTGPIAFSIGVEAEPETDAPMPISGQDTPRGMAGLDSVDQPATARLEDGGWVHAYSDSDGVWFRRYDSNGALISEAEHVSTPGESADEPRVIALVDGGFTIGWEGSGPADSDAVWGRQYDAEGTPLFDPVQINPVDSSSQSSLDLAALPSGGWLAVWRDMDDDRSLWLQRFDASGQMTSRDGSAPGADAFGEFGVDAYQPGIAIGVDGSVAVIWREYRDDGPGSSSDVRLQLVADDGAPFGAPVTVNQTISGSQYPGAVLATSAGGFAVAWAGRGVGASDAAYVRIYSASGTPISDEIRVSEQTSGAGDVDLTLLEGGRLLASWRESSELHAQLLTETGARLDSNFLINDVSNGVDGEYGLAGLPGGGFVGFWENDGIIESRVFGDPAAFDAGGRPEIVGVPEALEVGESAAQAGLIRLGLGQAAGFAQSGVADFDGARLMLSVSERGDVEEFAGADGIGQDVLGLVSGDMGAGDVQVLGGQVWVDGTEMGTLVSGGIGGAALDVVFNEAATREGIEATITALGYRNPSDAPDESRTLRLEFVGADDRRSDPLEVAVTVSSEIDSGFTAGSVRTVNSETENRQLAPAAIELADGSFVVVWTSYVLGVGDERPRAQLYAADGSPVGGELDLTPSAWADTDMRNIDVTDVVALSDGGFAILGHRDPTSGYDDAWFEIYDASGIRTGVSGALNGERNGNSVDPHGVATEDGGFTAVWRVDDHGVDGSYSAIMQANVAADGTVGTVERVNAVETESYQRHPRIAAVRDEAGDPAGHVALFSSRTDGDDYGVFARLYGRDGAWLGDEFRINQCTEDSQELPAVAGLSGGGFVVVWQSANQDGSGAGIYARLYSSDGTALGEEFRANESTLLEQSDPDVIALQDGGFVVAWSGYDATTSSDHDVMAQRYDASGNRIDGEFHISPDDLNSSQYNPALFARALGGFGVAWDEETYDYTAWVDTGDGSSRGVKLRLFDNPAPELPESPTLGDLDRYLTLRTSDVIAAPQILDDSVAFEGSDDGFAGGAIRLYWVSNGGADDQISILSSGPVSVSGADLQVDGVTVGTIDAVDSGADGASLAIALNAQADGEAVRLILEHVAYSSGRADPATLNYAHKTLGVIVADADGDQIEPDAVHIYLHPSSTDNGSFGLWNVFLNENENSSYLPVQPEADFAHPRTLDGAIDLDGFDGASFDGGFVYVDASGAYGTLSVRDDGAGVRRIGFDGENVSYGGVVIGMVNEDRDGAAGTRLQIDLNASASSQAVEALLEAFTLSLADPVSTPSANTRVTFHVRDGEGRSVNASGYLNLSLDRREPASSSGPDRQVNDWIEGAQGGPEMTKLPDGGYVTFWDSQYQDDETSDYGVYGQRFDSHGREVGPEFRVNGLTEGSQQLDDATTLADGRVLVLWTDSAGADGSEDGLYATILSSEGEVEAAAIQVADSVLREQYGGRVAALADGRFFVVYTSEETRNNQWDVRGRMFGADGTPAGGGFQINTTTDGRQEAPIVVELPDGDLMVVWRDDAALDGSGSGVFAQRIDASGTGSLLSFDGTSVGADETLINEATWRDQSPVKMAVLASSETLPDGGFAVAINGRQAGDYDAYVRIFDVDGVAVTSDVRVNPNTRGHDYVDDLVATPDGGLYVIWGDSYSSGSSDFDVLARKIGPDGRFEGPPIRANHITTQSQDSGAAAMLSNGTLAVSWRNYSDGDSYGIFQKRLDAPEFGPGEASPELTGDFSAQVAEEEVNAGLVLLNSEGPLGLVDADSPDFEGGILSIWKVARPDDHVTSLLGSGDDQTQDRLSFLDGDGVTLSGGELRVDGSTIGVLVADGAAGSDLKVELNAAATPQSLERALARLAYAN